MVLIKSFLTQVIITEICALFLSACYCEIAGAVSSMFDDNQILSRVNLELNSY